MWEKFYPIPEKEYTVKIGWQQRRDVEAYKGRDNPCRVTSLLNFYSGTEIN